MAPDITLIIEREHLIGIEDADTYTRGQIDEKLAGKVNSPETSGTSGQVLQTNGDGTTSWVDQSTGVDVDDTLTIQGDAADAKKTGDEISGLKSDLNSIESVICTTVTSKNLIDPSVAVVGRLQSDGTINDGMTNYKTSDYILLEGGKTYVYARESLTSAGTALITGYFGYGFYDTSKNWVSNSRVWADYSDTSNPPTLVITPANDCYIRVCANKNYFADDTTGKVILQEGSTLDGYEAYFAPYTVVNVLTPNDISQSTGSDTTKIMSQKAVTDYVDGVKIPSGGTTGQVLKKHSATDYDVEWADESSGSAITVDSELSDSSTNPVQNKVITGVINEVTDISYSINLFA